MWRVPQTPPPDGLPQAAWITRLAEPLARPAAGGPGALAGLRFAVKDNIDAAGLPTTAACPAFAHMPAEDAEAVRRLLDAGALLLGKTNLDQFACGLNGTRSPYGAVPNSFDARYVSGGSSSGSAYVVATGEVDFALGTDTAGSGRVPAGLNNIVGIKPSRGLISAFGVVPAAQSVDCVSIFARTVDVAARVLQVAMGPDARDPYSRRLPLAAPAWPQRFRFGVPSLREFFGDKQAEAAFAQAIAAARIARRHARCTIDYAPLAEAAGLLYDSALVAERYAAVREFIDAHPNDIVEPVRSILIERAALQRRRPGRGPDPPARPGAARRADVGADRRAAGAHRAHALHHRGDEGRAGGAQPAHGRLHQLRQPARLCRDLGAEQPARHAACPSASR